MKPTSHNHKGRNILFAIITASLPVTNALHAQAVKETTHQLSKQASKGLLSNALIKNDGSLVFTYAMRVDKNSEQLNYEEYVFDKDLNFKSTQPGSENKQSKPPKKVTNLWAYAGGGNSFNVLSQKLSISKVEGEATWNFKKQRYNPARRISSEKIKLKNEDGRYDGYVAWPHDNGVLIIASYEPEKNKEVKEQFVALDVDLDLKVTETPVTLGGNYSLVFAGQRESGNAFVIMAPKKKMPDTRQYVYAEFTNRAQLVHRTTFTAPSPNMMVMDYNEMNGELFLVAGSAKSNDAYEEEFPDYANIDNPGMGSSWQTQKYFEKAYKKDIEKFHLLNFKDGALVFAGTTLVKDFEKNVIAPPGQKKKHPYEGKHLYISTLNKTPDGGYLLAGQLMDNDLVKGSIVRMYKDFVGFYFNAKGELKAQYAVEKMNNDNKSEMFSSDQQFIMSADGKTAYWEILEVKGSKGYASFWDAYNGDLTFRAHYFPRIAKIDLSSASLSSFTVLGSEGKYLLNADYSRIMDEGTKTVYYIGNDNDYKNIWLGKFPMQ